jgi:N-acetylglutamate synthase-like GNAT family acetyltransferase
MSEKPSLADMIIRPAVAEDQVMIKQIIHEAQINPNNLDWPRFVVAQANGKIVGVGQVKPHKDGSRELASIAVIPDFQRRGIASRIIETLLAREQEPLYLMCEAKNEKLYQRFGFRRIEPPEMPGDLKRNYRFARLLRPIIALLMRYDLQIIAMHQRA